MKHAAERTNKGRITFCADAVLTWSQEHTNLSENLPTFRAHMFLPDATMNSVYVFLQHILVTKCLEKSYNVKYRGGEQKVISYVTDTS